MESESVQVVIRVRPPLPRELQAPEPYQQSLSVSQNCISFVENEDFDTNSGSHSFAFDKVYGEDSTQVEVYNSTARKVVSSCLEGYNATILAYGQTGTGKTYTMDGSNLDFDRRGIIPRAIEQIFSHIHTTVSPQKRFLVRASYLQIYNEVISDLLKPERTNLIIREESKNDKGGKGVFVEGLSEWVVRSPQEIYKLMHAGAAVRATGCTKLNEMSSRSHAVLIIIVEQCEATFTNEAQEEISPAEFHAMIHSEEFKRKKLNPESFVQQSFKVGKLNLVDLAGSERVRVSGARGQRLEETKKINQSLSALGNVIAALTDTKGRSHIPYRDSKLTRILEDSLGGNCKTTMMAMVSPAKEAISETLSTIKFANRAKNIKNYAQVNEDVDKHSLLRRYEKELQRLRAELQKKNRNVVDQRKLLELEEQKRQAEEDKMAAIRALESRSLEFMREKLAKKKLEEEIESLTGQMLTGENVQDTPQFRQALVQHRNEIRAEYRSKLNELERERESIEQQKAQVDRYKQLLIKQRDIMVALTQRLNERDDHIVALQEEIDSYERRFKDLEEKLDRKTASVIHLQRVALEQHQQSPNPNPDFSLLLDPDAFLDLNIAKKGENQDQVEMLRRLRQAVQNEIQTRLRNGINNEFVDVNELDLDVSAHGIVSVNQNNKNEEIQDRPEDSPNEDEMKRPDHMSHDKNLHNKRASSLEGRVRALTEKYKSFRNEMNSRLERKESEILELREENKQLLKLGNTDQELAKQVEVLRRRTINHAKEQVAVRTIMEKIQILVEGIIVSRSDTDKEREDEDDSDTLDSQFNALSNLVNASVQALRS